MNDIRNSLKCEMELGSYVSNGGPPVKGRVINRPIGQHGAPGSLQIVVGVYDPGRNVQRVPEAILRGRPQNNLFF